MDVPVQGRRVSARKAKLADVSLRADDVAYGRKCVMPCFQEKPRVQWSHVVTVPQTDTGRRGENPKALERTLVKELGKLTP